MKTHDLVLEALASARSCGIFSRPQLLDLGTIPDIQHRPLNACLGQLIAQMFPKKEEWINDKLTIRAGTRLLGRGLASFILNRLNTACDALVSGKYSSIDDLCTRNAGLGGSFQIAASIYRYAMLYNQRFRGASSDQLIHIREALVRLSKLDNRSQICKQFSMSKK